MELSKVVSGLEGRLISDGEFDDLNYCTAETDRSFLTFIEKEKFIAKMNPMVTCVLCSDGLVDKLPSFVKGIFVTDEPKFYFHQIYHMVGGSNEKTVRKVEIGPDCEISPLAYIADTNVVIGRNVIIEPFAIVNENVSIGDDCIIHSNVVLGGRSFSPARHRKSGETCCLDDRGQVYLEHDVEICCGTHVAQGIWPTDVTIIGAHSKIDVHCHIGHGAKIGKSVFIAAGAIIGGNTEIGDNAWVGINATVSNRLKVGADTRVSLGSVVTKDVGDGVTVTGNFAIEHAKFLWYLKNVVLGGLNRRV